MEGEDRFAYLDLREPSVARLLEKSNRTPLECELSYVYAIWRGDEVVYVGCTQNIEQRIGRHMKTALGEADVADSYSVVPFMNKADALAFERSMIIALDPEWNSQFLVDRESGVTQ